MVPLFGGKHRHGRDDHYICVAERSDHRLADLVAQLLRLDVVDGQIKLSGLQAQPNVFAELVAVPRQQLPVRLRALAGKRDQLDAGCELDAGHVDFTESSAGLAEARKRRVQRRAHFFVEHFVEELPRLHDARRGDCRIRQRRMFRQPRHDFESDRGIFDVARDRPDVIERPGQRMHAFARHGIVGRFEADDAATGSRLSNRSAGAGTDPDGGQFGGNSGGRSAAGTTRNMAGIARVLHVAEVGIGTVDAECQFMKIGRAHDQRASRPQSGNYRRIALLHLRLDRLGAGRQRIAAHRHEVLHAHRHTGQRPGVFATPEAMVQNMGFLHDQGRDDGDECVEVAMCLDASEKQFRDRHRRQRAIPDLVGNLHRAGGHQFTRHGGRRVTAGLKTLGRSCSGRRQHWHTRDNGFEHLLDVGQAEGEALLPIREALGMGDTGEMPIRRAGDRRWGGWT